MKEDLSYQEIKYRFMLCYAMLMIVCSFRVRLSKLTEANGLVHKGCSGTIRVSISKAPKLVPIGRSIGLSNKTQMSSY